MKAYFFSICIVCLASASLAQTPTWAWAKSGSLNTRGYSLTTDINNNVICICDSGKVIKYDSQGNVLWTKPQANGSTYGLSGIVSDNSGNLYVSGNFGTPFISLGSFTLTGTGSTGTAFVAKYDALGNEVWAMALNATVGSFAAGIFSDASGNVYITGTYASTMVLGTTTLISSGPQYDLFYAKINSGGQVLWGKSIPSTSNKIQSYGICADQNGNGYIYGSFNGPSQIIATDTLFNVILNGMAPNDNFVARFDALGSIVWARCLDSESVNVADNPFGFSNSMGIDNNGNCIVTGYITGSTLALGTVTLNNTSSLIKVFLIKYDPSGNILWARIESGNSYTFSRGLSIDAQGNSYILGLYGPSPAIFGSLTLASSSENIFVVKYDTEGNAVWGKSAGSNLGAYGANITRDLTGNLYLNGYYYGNAFTGSTSTLTINNTNGYTRFIAKLNNTIVGLDENSGRLSQIEMFPNPASHEITFGDANDKLSVKIVDITGKEVDRITITPKGSHNMDISSFNPGIYFFEIENESGQIVRKKLVKE